MGSIARDTKITSANSYYFRRNNLMDTVPQQARAFAVRAHGNQCYGERPYAYHLDQVAALAAPYGDEAVAIAYLHDTVEDTAATIAEIERRFGPKIAACVALLTDEPGADRKQRKARTYAKLAVVGGANEVALLVKTADRLANVRACVQDKKAGLWQMYRGEQAAFRAAVYRSGLCDAMWAELDSALSDSAWASPFNYGPFCCSVTAAATPSANVASMSSIDVAEP
jgi:(p)ppGpp synthase/HD superfamily hydrolase